MKSLFYWIENIKFRCFFSYNGAKATTYSSLASKLLRRSLLLVLLPFFVSNLTFFFLGALGFTLSLISCNCVPMWPVPLGFFSVNNVSVCVILSSKPSKYCLFRCLLILFCYVGIKWRLINLACILIFLPDFPSLCDTLLQVFYVLSQSNYHFFRCL